jgi:hypothetical protein
MTVLVDPDSTMINIIGYQCEFTFQDGSRILSFGLPGYANTMSRFHSLQHVLFYVFHNGKYGD